MFFRKTLKKTTPIIILVCTLILGGCFSFTQKPETKAPTDERSRLIENSEFSVRIPREWDIIEPKDFTSEVPQNTLMVFRNNVKNENFTANVNILKNNLLTEKTTLEYAKEIINRQKTGLYNYAEIKRDLVKIQTGDKKVDTYLIKFAGKKSAESEMANFIQIYAAKGNFAYIVTGALSPKETSNAASIIEEIIKSFGVK